MFFYDFKDHPEARVNPSLLWEYDMDHFDFQEMRHIVVQRVVERGWKEDWNAILNLYSLEGVIEAIREIPYLNDKDMHFVSMIFEIPISELKCYGKIRSNPAHWNS